MDRNTTEGEQNNNFNASNNEASRAQKRIVKNINAGTNKTIIEGTNNVVTDKLISSGNAHNGVNYFKNELVSSKEKSQNSSQNESGSLKNSTGNIHKYRCDFKNDLSTGKDIREEAKQIEKKTQTNSLDKYEQNKTSQASIRRDVNINEKIKNNIEKHEKSKDSTIINLIETQKKSEINNKISQFLKKEDEKVSETTSKISAPIPHKTRKRRVTSTEGFVYKAKKLSVGISNDKGSNYVTKNKNVELETPVQSKFDKLTNDIETENKILAPKINNSEKSKRRSKKDRESRIDPSDLRPSEISETKVESEKKQVAGSNETKTDSQIDPQSRIQTKGLESTKLSEINEITKEAEIKSVNKPTVTKRRSRLSRKSVIDPADLSSV